MVQISLLYVFIRGPFKGITVFVYTDIHVFANQNSKGQTWL